MGSCETEGCETEGTSVWVAVRLKVLVHRYSCKTEGTSA